MTKHCKFKLRKRSQPLLPRRPREVDVGGRAGCCGAREGRRGQRTFPAFGAPPLAPHAAAVDAFVVQAHGEAAAWRAGCAAPAVPPTCCRRCCTRQVKISPRARVLHGSGLRAWWHRLLRTSRRGWHIVDQYITYRAADHPILWPYLRIRRAHPKYALCARGKFLGFQDF